jgi:hypothetical protein
LVLDQFGDPMPYLEVYVKATQTEGGNADELVLETLDFPYEFGYVSDDGAGEAVYEADITTDGYGKFTIDYEQDDPYDWGVHVFQAFAYAGSTVKSNTATVDWAIDDWDEAYTWAEHGRSTVNVGYDYYGMDWYSEFPAWDEDTPVNVFLNPTGSSINNGSFWFDPSEDVAISITHTFAASDEEPYYVKFTGTNSDDAPNWIYQRTEGPYTGG